MPPSAPRMPTLFVPHGGGPWPWMDPPLGGPGSTDELQRYLETLGALPPARPSAVLVVSAHWEAPVPTVMSSARPPMLYDYRGFPAQTYQVQWPAPGAPPLATEVRQRLEGSGIQSAEDPARGFDHGTFVVTALAYPKAEIPTFQLSLQRGLDPLRHLAIGRALTPLRDQGVLILGSGMSYHNMQGLRTAMNGGDSGASDDSAAFHDWLATSMQHEASARERSLAEWEQAPRARACHPREEHLLPLMVVAGAAGDDAATLPYRGTLLGVETCAIQFG